MNLGDLSKKAELFVGENSSSILTGVGVAGTVTTAVLTGRSTFRAAAILQKENGKIRLESDGLNNVDDLDLRDKAQLVWTLYIPPAAAGVATIASIVMANRISSKKAAALAAAYGISERAFQEYRAKVVEKLGEHKATAIRDEIAQERISRTEGSAEVVIVEGGDVLCFDEMSGRYFKSSMEKIRRAENTANFDILNHMYYSLTSFYEEIGLDGNMWSDEVGFNTENRVQVTVSTTTSPDNKPCLSIGFVQGPIANYKNLY